MDLHTSTSSATPGSSAVSHTDAAARPAAPASLVLVVGTALRPVAEAAELRAAGVRCICVATLEQALDAAPSVSFDSVVLHGQGLAGIRGVWLPRLRETLGCPIVLVAEQADEVDEILALELGADAFLVRPLAPRRLCAHLLRLIQQRRSGLGGTAPGATPWTTPALELGRWKVDRVRSRLTHGATVIHITAGQAALLSCLAEARGRVVPRRQLLDMLNSRDELAVRSVDVYVSRLRRLLARERVTDIEVVTVRARGYALHIGESTPSAH
jgi:DNA-binding response OmpR family regulator